MNFYVFGHFEAGTKNSDGPTKRTPVTEQIFPGPRRLPRDLPGDPRGPFGDLPGTPGDPPGQQKRPYLYKFPAPEALDCCVQTCLLQRIAPKRPRDRFIYKKATKINNRGSGAYHGGPGVYP